MRVGTDIQLHTRLDNEIHRQKGKGGMLRKAYEWRVNIQCSGAGPRAGNEESDGEIVSRAVGRASRVEYGVDARKRRDAIRHRHPRRSGGRSGGPSSYKLY